MADVLEFPSPLREAEVSKPISKRPLRALRFLYERVLHKQQQPQRMLVIFEDAEGSISYLNLGFTADGVTEATGQVIGSMLRKEHLF